MACLLSRRTKYLKCLSLQSSMGATAKRPEKGGSWSMAANINEQKSADCSTVRFGCLTQISAPLLSQERNAPVLDATPVIILVTHGFEPCDNARALAKLAADILLSCFAVKAKSRKVHIVRRWQYSARPWLSNCRTNNATPSSGGGRLCSAFASINCITHDRFAVLVRLQC